MIITFLHYMLLQFSFLLEISLWLLFVFPSASTFLSSLRCESVFGRANCLLTASSAFERLEIRAPSAAYGHSWAVVVASVECRVSRALKSTYFSCFSLPHDGRERRTKVATILVFHLWHNFRFVWKEICQFRTKPANIVSQPATQLAWQDRRSSEWRRQSPFCVSRRPSTVGSWQRDSLERPAGAGLAVFRGHGAPGTPQGGHEVAPTHRWGLWWWIVSGASGHFRAPLCARVTGKPRKARQTIRI